MPPSHTLHGPMPPTSPVVLSVPHAGRDYPAALGALLRVPLVALRPLEDRYVDVLALAAAGERTAIVQTRARAWIDLNRAEDERDPAVDQGARATRLPLQSVKLRSGLGLVPRRVAGAGDLWRRRLADGDVRARIAADHRPYHAALQQLLAAAHDRFGVAVLLDVHSMPPLAAARIVLGDRFGRSAAGRFLARAEAVAEAAGVATALNTPYAGGHILMRHAAPARGIHAIQIEFDRALYLDPALDAPGPGLGTTAALLRRIIAALEDEALSGGLPLAAE